MVLPWWCNGSHDRLKTGFPNGSAGSNPARGTKQVSRYAGSTPAGGTEKVREHMSRRRDDDMYEQDE